MPVQYAIYKGNKGKWGAAQFQIQKAHRYCTECKKKADFVQLSCMTSNCSGKLIPREGAVFVDVASATGENIYDWTKKITFALGIVDLGKILYGMRTATEGTEIKLMHDPGAQTESMGKVKKFFSLSSPKGPGEGFMLRIAEQSGDANKVHTVPMTADEATVLSTLIASAIAQVLDW